MIVDNVIVAEEVGQISEVQSLVAAHFDAIAATVPPARFDLYGSMLQDLRDDAIELASRAVAASYYERMEQG